MKNKKIFNFKKMNMLGKVGLSFAIASCILVIILTITWSLMVGLVEKWENHRQVGNETIITGTTILTDRQKLGIILFLIVILICEIFNLVMTILFVKGKLNCKTLIGILNLIPFLLPGIFILLGEGEVEKLSIPAVPVEN